MNVPKELKEIQERLKKLEVEIIDIENQCTNPEFIEKVVEEIVKRAERKIENGRQQG